MPLCGFMHPLKNEKRKGIEISYFIALFSYIMELLSINNQHQGASPHSMALTLNL